MWNPRTSATRHRASARSSPGKISSSMQYAMAVNASLAFKSIPLNLSRVGMNSDLMLDTHAAMRRESPSPSYVSRSGFSKRNGGSTLYSYSASTSKGSDPFTPQSVCARGWFRSSIYTHRHRCGRSCRHRCRSRSGTDPCPARRTRQFSRKDSLRDIMNCQQQKGKPSSRLPSSGLNTRLRRWAQVISMDGMYAGFAGAKSRPSRRGAGPGSWSRWTFACSDLRG